MILVGVPHHALHGGIIVLDLALSPSVLLHRAAFRDRAADGRGSSPPRAATGAPESASVEEGNAQERYPRRRKHQIGASISDDSHRLASPRCLCSALSNLDHSMTVADTFTEDEPSSFEGTQDQHCFKLHAPKQNKKEIHLKGNFLNINFMLNYLKDE